MQSLDTSAAYRTAIVIGGLPINISADRAEFIALLMRQYRGFLGPPAAGGIEFEVELTQPRVVSDDDELEVEFAGGQYLLHRGDFAAEWDPITGHGRLRCSANPYAVDSMLRIVHSLALASRGGILLHAASVVRQRQAFVFAGISGAGKTTIARLRPADALLLSDEISYVRLEVNRFHAWGTPFCGELEIPGHNVSAPVAALYLLVKEQRNQLRTLAPSRAVEALMRNVLFFAKERELLDQLFATVCGLVTQVPVYELAFRPEPAVWDAIE